jgi:hypothetical protein
MIIVDQEGKPYQVGKIRELEKEIKCLVNYIIEILDSIIDQTIFIY